MFTSHPWKGGEETIFRKRKKGNPCLQHLERDGQPQDMEAGLASRHLTPAQRQQVNKNKPAVQISSVK